MPRPKIERPVLSKRCRLTSPPVRLRRSHEVARRESEREAEREQPGADHEQKGDFVVGHLAAKGRAARRDYLIAAQV
jgi:hypothetical protein